MLVCLPQVIRYWMCYACDIGRNGLWSMYCIYKVYLTVFQSNSLTQEWRFMCSLLLETTYMISNSSCAFSDNPSYQKRPGLFQTCGEVPLLFYNISFFTQYCPFSCFCRCTISVIWCCLICVYAVYISINSYYELVIQSPVFTNQLHWSDCQFSI